MQVRRVLLALIMLGPLWSPALAGQAPQDQLSNVKGLVDQARTSFDALDYENTIKALDSAIAAIEARPTPEARRLLPQAYEMRARSLFGLSKEAEAKNDFLSLLKVEPGYTLSGQVSPRIATMFDELIKANVTELRLVVVPADAEVQLDGDQDRGHRDYANRRRRSHAERVAHRLPVGDAAVHRGSRRRPRSSTR